MFRRSSPAVWTLRDRGPFTRIVIAVLEHQTDSLGPRLRVVLARHEMHLPNKGGAHQTRDGSIAFGGRAGYKGWFVVWPVPAWWVWSMVAARLARRLSPS